MYDLLGLPYNMAHCVMKFKLGFGGLCFQLDKKNECHNQRFDAFCFNTLTYTVCYLVLVKTEWLVSLSNKVVFVALWG